MKNEELIRKRENSILHIKSYAFSLRIIKMYRFLLEGRKEYILSKQVLRSGTAIGALVRESEFAQSSADFINKLNIALKEANETDYWLNLLHDSDYIDDLSFNSIQDDCGELIALLISSIKTKRNNKQKEEE
ncbi:MAG: four helix bundle protein [Bacteroidaceae bacterium]|nr:four helix bundle protein [Bacteroidaceae bacterium]